MGRPYKRKDHYYERAKSEGYRSRAAYKLQELNKRYRLLKPGMRVIDLGCYPGGWLQVAQQIVGQKGSVVGIDLQEVEALAEIRIVKGDIYDQKTRQGLLEEGRFDVVLSDMSPALSGIRVRDAVRSAELVEAALDFAEHALKPGGAFVAKIFPGEECEELAKRVKQNFGNFARPCLESSRGSSKELYFVGTAAKRQN